MSHEQSPVKHENKNVHVSPAESREHHERLREKIESDAEKAGGKSTAETEARHEVHEVAQSSAEMTPTSSETQAQSTPPVKTKYEKRKSFDTTMHHVRKDMNTAERTLSKLVHQPVVEKTSEVVGKTIARPSGIIGAAIAAGIGLLFVFGVARYVGFELSGSEMPLLLGAGLLIGLFSEWAYKSARSIVLPKK